MFDRLRRTFKSWFRIGQIDERPGSNLASDGGDEGQEDARSVVTASPVLAGESEPLSNRVGGDGEISANLSPNLPKVDIVFATKDLLEQAQRLEKSAGPWAFRLGMTCRLLDRAACRMALERLSLIDPMAADYERRQLEEASADKLISRQFGERPAELTSISN